MNVECETVIEFLNRKISQNSCVYFFYFILVNYPCAASSMLGTSDVKDQLTKVRSLCDILEIS